MYIIISLLNICIASGPNFCWSGPACGSAEDCFDTSGSRPEDGVKELFTGDKYGN